MSTKKEDHEKLKERLTPGLSVLRVLQPAHLSATIAWVAWFLFTERTEESNERARATPTPG